MDGDGVGAKRSREDEAFRRMVVGGYATTFLAMPQALVGGDLWAGDDVKASVLFATGLATALVGIAVIRGARFVS